MEPVHTTLRSESGAAPLLLLLRLDPAPDQPPPSLCLALTAEDRTRLRGHRRTVCGQDLLLQLPRGAALRPGDWLADAQGQPRVRVEAAPESLLRVRADDPLELLRAAYHLGNRHVALEVRPAELRLLDDAVLEDLLRARGLRLERCLEPFAPEGGAYGDGHDHGHGHSHDQGHDHSHPAAPHPA